MSTRPERCSPAFVEERVAPVLADLEFPARRWQVLTVADLYGVDTATRSLLELLPERRYHSLAEVAGVLAAVLVRPPAAAAPAPAPPVPATRHPALARPLRAPAPVVSRPMARPVA